MSDYLAIYNVTLQGISGGYQFDIDANIGIASTITTGGTLNGVNPFDIIIITENDPASIQSSGAILFTTNTALFGGRAQLDTSYVSVGNNEILIQPDPSDTSVTQSRFSTNSSGSSYNPLLLPDFYRISYGTVTLQFQGNIVVGEIDINGYGFINASSSASYRATLYGVLSEGNGIFSNPSPDPSPDPLPIVSPSPDPSPDPLPIVSPSPDPLPIVSPSPLNKLNTEFTRFHNTGVPGTYLFAGPTEAANIRRNFPGFKEEGMAFQVGVEPNDDLLRFTRFQNRQKPGTYLFAGPGEAANIRQNFPNFQEEGVAFYALDSSRNLGTQIYRFQNTSVPGTYLFAGPAEKDNILANFSNFRLEGEAFEVVG